jgi:glyoxylase-like metal-dependent hydrolase (beta-lactamase superfamily II)
MRKISYLLLFAALCCAHVWAQSPQEGSAQTSGENLRKYVPVLPPVRAHFWKIDPAVGYAVKDFGGGVYVVSDNGRQSAFLVSDEGVIVFDAPASFGKHIPAAIAIVTDKPIKFLVYSHSHKDHIGGSAAFKNIPGLQIVALDGVSNFLKEMNDPGAGIGDLPPLAQPELLGERKLVEVMHNWHFSLFHLWVVLIGNRYLPRPVRIFKEFAAQMAPKLFPKLPV